MLTKEDGMAEFQKVAQEKKRMCSKVSCAECLLGDHVANVSACAGWMIGHPKEAERIIMQWSAEHPIKTNGMKFEEVFGFTLHHKFCVSGDAVEWLNEEYEKEE